MGTRTGFSKGIENIPEEKLLNDLKEVKQHIALSFGSAIANSCAKQIEAHIITTFLDTGFGLDVINNVASRQKPVSDTDLISLIFEMCVKARERSHGAAILHKVFLRKDLYEKLLSDAGASEAKKCIVNRVEVVLSDEVTNKYPIVGVCRSKFDTISSDLLVITGEINAN